MTKGICSNRYGPISALDIPVHIGQILASIGIERIDQLEEITESEILAIEAMTPTCVAKLKFALAKDGYNLGAPPDSDASCYRFADPYNPKPRNTPFTARWQDFLPGANEKC